MSTFESREHYHGRQVPVWGTETFLVLRILVIFCPPCVLEKLSHHGEDGSIFKILVGLSFFKL